MRRNELYHYGVKGMKWRHHNKDRYAGKITGGDEYPYPIPNSGDKESSRNKRFNLPNHIVRFILDSAPFLNSRTRSRGLKEKLWKMYKTGVQNRENKRIRQNVNNARSRIRMK